MDMSDTTVFRRRGNSCYKLIAMIAVITGIYVSIVSVLRFGRFLAAFNTALPSDNGLLPCIYFRIIVNWTLASCYVYLPSIVRVVIERIGNLCGLPDCYFKFTKIVLLSSILNGVIGFWQEIPEICLWNLNKLYHAEIIHFYLHCSMWTISFMIMLAIDIFEITGLEPIFYYLINENYSSLKSRQFDRFLSNLGFPGSSCILIMLWSQKLMSFDRLLLAVIWTIGILSYNQTDDTDIKYVAKQIEKKKARMYYSDNKYFSRNCIEDKKKKNHQILNNFATSTPIRIIRRA